MGILSDMGVIEDTIYENYRTSIKLGNIKQAKLAVELAKDLIQKKESLGFLDYNNASPKKTTSRSSGNIFKPIPYNYYPENGIIVINQSAITLTPLENKLLLYLSESESAGANITIIRKNELFGYLWPLKKPSNSALRILIRRLRLKLESDPNNPKIIINFYSKGYIFLGKNTNL